MNSSKEELVKEERKKIIDKMAEIEKRMQNLLEKEKAKLLAEVDDVVTKKKIMLPNINDEE